MEHGKFPREKFMAEVVKTTKGIVARVKSFEEDDSAARVTDIVSPTDGKPMIETLRGYKSKDGELMIYKVIGNRKMAESEVKDLLVQGPDRPPGRIPLQGRQGPSAPSCATTRRRRRPSSCSTASGTRPARSRSTSPA